jgi:hypothetical protein
MLAGAVRAESLAGKQFTALRARHPIPRRLLLRLRFRSAGGRCVDERDGVVLERDHELVDRVGRVERVEQLGGDAEALFDQIAFGFELTDQVVHALDRRHHDHDRDPDHDRDHDRDRDPDHDRDIEPDRDLEYDREGTVGAARIT